MRIGIDLDNTVENLSECVVMLYNTLYDDNLDFNSIDHYWFEDLMHEDVRKNAERLYIQAGMFITAYKNAREVIELLQREGHEIYFVTSSTLEGMLGKRDRIETLFPSVPYKNWIITHYKNLVDVDVLINDYEKNLENFKNVKILYSQPWNAKVETKKFEKEVDKNCIYRVNNWEEIDNLIHKIL